MHSLLAAIALLAVTLAQVAPPPISAHAVELAILSDLAYNAPHVTIDLDGEKSTPAILALVRANVLHVAGRTRRGGLEPPGRLILELTKKGQNVATQRGWAIRGGVIEIPTGRLVFVQGTETVTQDGSIAHVSFRWRYEPNSNLRYLQSIAALPTWPGTVLPNCVGLAGTAGVEHSIVVVRDHSGDWSNYNDAMRDCEAAK